MDLPRKPRARWRPWAFAAGAILAVVLLVVSWSALSHVDGGVSVDRSNIVTDVARTGTLDRSISASGTLVSEAIHVVSASEPGVVSALLVKPGVRVQTGDPVARLDNPDLDGAVIDAQSELRVAVAQLGSATEQARASALGQQSALATAQAQLQEAQANAKSLASLHDAGLIADSTYRIAMIRLAQSRRQVELSGSQVDVDAAQQGAMIAAARAKVDEASSQLASAQARVDALTVRAGATGVVLSTKIDVGQHVDAGSELTRIADQRTLKAVLNVPENQVQYVSSGMSVRVNTGGGTAIGRVGRIAPSAENGAVAVDVTLSGSLPPGSRPDTAVDATIELQRIPNALSIARPANASDNTTMRLFRLTRDGSRAVPVEVHLGPGSTDRIQVLSGLSAGDTVVVSDTSAYNQQASLQIH